MRVEGVEARVHSDGHLYLRRDLVEKNNVRERLFPQHAVLFENCCSPDVEGFFDRLVWVGHREGGRMEPLIRDYGPDAGDPEDEDEFDNPWIGD